MNNKPTFLQSIFSTLLFLLPFSAISQVQLRGVVRDSLDHIPYANVLLTNDQDEIVSGTVTSEDGSFLIHASKGTYNLSVSFVGYEKYETRIELDHNKDVGTIQLIPLTMDEVVVLAPKDLIERKVDRLVFNVEDHVATIGGTSLDALKISPGIAITNDQITMIGKSGMRVMVDDKVVPLAGEELVNFLSSIPADDIKQIEIITNPPAKYEAEGNSGLINIIYKKGRKNSWSNTSSFSYAQALYSIFTLRNNFSYQKNRLSFLLSVNGRTGNTNVERYSDIFYPGEHWEIHRKEKWNNDNLSGRLTLDYKIGANSTIGFQYLGFLSDQDPGQTTISEAVIFNPANEIDSLLINSGASIQKNNSHSLNTYYKTNLDTLGRSVTVNLDYFGYVSDHERNVEAESYTSGDEFGIVFSNRNFSDQELTNYSAKIDVEHPLEGLNLSYGAKISFTNSNYVTMNFNTIGDAPELNPMFSDDFEYIENNQALYINGSKRIGEKWEAQVGLRMENTQTEGFSNTLDQVTKNDYMRLFPTLYFSYKMNDRNDFSLNYGRRIRRPLYYQLNPARNYISNTNFTEGNPLLQPSFIDNFEFTHNLNGKLITNLFVSVESEGFDEISDISEETNQQFFTFQNFYTQYNYGLSEYYVFNKIPWWESQNSIYLIRSESKFYVEGISAQVQNGLRFFASTNNTFSFNQSKTIRGQVNYWYSSPFKSNLYQFSKSYNLDIILSFSMLQKNLNVSLGAYDVFNSSPRRSTFITNDIRQTQISYWSARQFRMSLVYSFGNSKINVRDRAFGNEEEKRRAN